MPLPATVVNVDIRFSGVTATGAAFSLPVKSLYLNCALNNIPTCRVELPLGVAVVYGQQIPGFSSYVTAFLNSVTRVYVYAIIRTASPGGSPVTFTITLFEGYVTSIEYNRSFENTAAGIVLNLVHWLVDLASSSTISENATIRNPSNFYDFVGFMKIRPDLGAGDDQQGGGGNPTLITDLVGDDIFTPESIFGRFDLLILRFFQGISMFNSLALPEFGLMPYGQLNLRLLSSIVRFEPLCGSLYANPPLTFSTLSRYYADVISENISREFSTISFDQLTSTTVWNKMLELGERFLYDIVPMATRALIVPRVGARTYIYKVIKPNEIVAVTVSGSYQRPVRGIIVPSEALAVTGAADSTQTNPDGVLGGVFFNPIISYGMIDTIYAPSWLSRSVPLDLAGLVPPIDPNQQQQPEPIPPEQIEAENARTVLYEFAKYSYAKTYLSGRTATIVTFPRVDINVGSQVSVLLPATPDSLVPGNLQFFGTVNKFILHVSADPPKAETILEVTDFFGPFEAVMPAANASIWKPGWRGCPWVDITYSG